MGAQLTRDLLVHNGKARQLIEAGAVEFSCLSFNSMGMNPDNSSGEHNVKSTTVI
jgi:hypothetical protein